MLRTPRQIRWAQAALAVFVLASWELLPRFGVIPRLFVPSLSEAIGALYEYRAEYLAHLPATLVEILKNLRSYGGKLKLTNLSAKVKGLFEITKLDKLFDIVPEEEDAVGTF